MHICCTCVYACMYGYVVQQRSEEDLRCILLREGLSPILKPTISMVWCLASKLPGSISLFATALSKRCT